MQGLIFVAFFNLYSYTPVLGVRPSALLSAVHFSQILALSLTLYNTVKLLIEMKNEMKNIMQT